MKIKIHILAFDGNNTGTDVSWFYSERELNEALLDLIMDTGDDQYAAAKQALVDGDEDGFFDIIHDHAESRSATWQSDTATVDTEKAEVVT